MLWKRAGAGVSTIVTGDPFPLMEHQKPLQWLPHNVILSLHSLHQKPPPIVEDHHQNNLLTGFCKLVVSCKMSSLASYNNNRWVRNNANLIYLISGFSILHLQTDNQPAKHRVLFCAVWLAVHSDNQPAKVLQSTRPYLYSGCLLQVLAKHLSFLPSLSEWCGHCC